MPELTGPVKPGKKQQYKIAAPANEAGLLLHWHAIGAYLGMAPDAARHLVKTAGLPVFKLGGKTVCARRAAIDQWIKQMEQGA